MTREILFRGKRRDNGQWAYGLPAYGSGGEINYISGWMGEDGEETFKKVEIDPKTVGQYIGKNDKKENKIFEGHLLRGRHGLTRVVDMIEFNIYADNNYHWFLDQEIENEI